MANEKDEKKKGKSTGGKQSTVASEKKDVKKPKKDIQAELDAAFIDEENDEEAEAYYPNTAERREIRIREEFVRKVLSDADTDEGFGNVIKQNFASKKTKKQNEFSEILARAERFSPDHKTGLSFAEVSARKERGLINTSQESNAKTYRSIFFENIVTFFNMLCVIVAIALVSVQSYSNLAFLFMMVVNTVIGIFQEIRAKHTIEKLSLLSSTSAVVVRDGENVNIPNNEIVLDDIIFLENGRQICADSILVKGEIEVNESLLTGESVPVQKRAGDTLYAGSFVSSGSCYARVDKIGNANYISSLSAFAKKYKRAKSEILSSLKMIIAVIGVVVIVITPFLFYNHYTLAQKELAENPSLNFSIFERAITLTSGAIIGMIPAGMFLLTSVALAVSVNNLGNRNILVQDLYCIEMLARVDLLCLDKTGTLTDGTMAVNSVIELKNESGHELKEIVGNLLTATGDNNQTAIAMARHFGYSKSLAPSVIMPFSSQRKLSAVSFEDGNTYILGAPEFVMRDMGPRMERIINQKAKEGYRVMLLAWAQGEIKADKLPLQRKPLAIIAIEDHIREDAFATLDWFKKNGVGIKVISGDNPITVSEVAKRVGVVNADLYVSLEGKTDPEVVELASQYTVFGRVTPEQKRILIRSFKAKGKTVAMTGDGVNDILALKEADCSVAIAAGSEAARNVSHMVLLDSNFAHMPSVVHEGRRVVNNIQKSSSLYLMKTLFSIIVAVLVMVLGTYYPFQPKHLMPLELFVIGIPSFFLAFEANKNRIEGNFLANIVKKAFPAGFTLICTFLALYMYNNMFPEDFNVEGASLFTTTAIWTITFAGTIMLVKLCTPLNFFRVFLCLICSLLAALALVFFGSNFFEIHSGLLERSQVLLILLLVQAAFFLVSILTALFSKLRINDPKDNPFSELDFKKHEG